MMGFYKLLKYWKYEPRKMVQMVQPNTNITSIKLALMNINDDEADLIVT